MTQIKLPPIKQGGFIDASLMNWMKGLEDENFRLKKMYAEARIKLETCKEALEGKLKPFN